MASETTIEPDQMIKGRMGFRCAAIGVPRKRLVHGHLAARSGEVVQVRAVRPVIAITSIDQVSQNLPEAFKLGQFSLDFVQAAHCDRSDAPTRPLLVGVERQQLATVLRGESEASRALNESKQELAVRKNAFATRVNYGLTAQYQLMDAETKEAVFTGGGRVVGSYNISQSEYATLIAARDARAKAVREMSENIRTDLGVFFLDQAKASRGARGGSREGAGRGTRRAPPR